MFPLKALSPLLRSMSVVSAVAGTIFLVISATQPSGYFIFIPGGSIMIGSHSPFWWAGALLYYFGFLLVCLVVYGIGQFVDVVLSIHADFAQLKARRAARQSAVVGGAATARAMDVVPPGHPDPRSTQERERDEVAQLYESARMYRPFRKNAPPKADV